MYKNFQNEILDKTLHYNIDYINNWKKYVETLEDPKLKSIIYLYLYRLYIYILPTDSAATAVQEQKPHTIYKYNPLDGVRYTIPRFNYFLLLYTCLRIHKHTHTQTYILYIKVACASLLFRNGIEVLTFTSRGPLSTTPSPRRRRRHSSSRSAGTTLLHTVLLSSGQGIVFRLIGCDEGPAFAYMYIMTSDPLAWLIPVVPYVM